MRIASLVPSATEALFALGLGDEVVAVTHECDHPAEVASLPRLTRSVVEEGLGAAAIDSRVLELTSRGEALYELDEGLLARLEPDLIVTQALCAVCAVSYDDVRAVAERLPSHPRVLSLDPTSLEQVLDDLLAIAAAAGRPGRGRRLREGLAARIEAVAAGPRTGARVLALEWLDPPYLGGHWVPEMVAVAGGRNLGLAPGERSRTTSWEELRLLEPELVVVMPCGLYAEQAAAEARHHAAQLASLGAERVHAVDAAASFSRPGPRLVDGVELLAALILGRGSAAGSDLGQLDLSDEIAAARQPVG